MLNMKTKTHLHVKLSDTAREHLDEVACRRGMTLTTVLDRLLEMSPNEIIAALNLVEKRTVLTARSKSRSKSSEHRNLR